MTKQTHDDPLPEAVLDPVLSHKIDTWHAAQLRQLAALRGMNAGTPDRPIRVLFLVPDTAMWDVYASLYQSMVEAEDFAPSVLAFRSEHVKTALTEAQTAEFFATRAIPALTTGFDGEPVADLMPGSHDVIFYTLGSVAYPPTLQIEFTSLSFLTCYLSYGFLLARQYNYQFNQPFHHSSWLLFASTERERSLYEHFSHRRTPNVTVTGYPKFDVLYEAPRGHGRPTVIWAPHWTIGAIYPDLNLGTFHQNCMEMIEVFKSFPECDFVYKPHPTLPHALERTTFMPPEQYQIYLRMLEAVPNVRIWLHGDYVDEFAHSAGMITESVSFLAEYLPANRPLLFLDREDRGLLSPLGEEIIELHYRGRTIEDIRRFIADQVLKHEDPRQAERVAATPRLLGLSDVRSSDAIMQILRDQIAGRSS